MKKKCCEKVTQVGSLWAQYTGLDVYLNPGFLARIKRTEIFLLGKLLKSDPWRAFM